MNLAIVREPTLLVTAFVYGLLQALCQLGGILGLWLGILLFMSIWRYSYQLMSAVAQGRERIPAPDIDSMRFFGGWTVFWHFVSFPGIIIATAPFQPYGSIVAVIVALIFPASAALMGVTASLSQAFNPVAIAHFARTVGRDYWALVGGTVGVFVGTSLLKSWILPVLDGISFVVANMVTIWALLAAFALIGSVIRTYRLEFEIGGELKSPVERQLERRHEDWMRDLDIAYAALRSESYAAGYKTLHDLVDREGDSIEVNYWLIENMLEWEEKRFALEVAVKLIPRLLEKGDADDALELYRRCRRRNAEFGLPKDVSVRLGQRAAAVGQTGLAEELGYTPENILTRKKGSTQ